MKIKTLLKFILICNIVSLLSCDNDEDNSENFTRFDKNAILSVEEINSTTVKFNINANDTENLKIGIKTENETEYTFLDPNTQTYNKLTPGSLYKTSLFTDFSETDSPFEIIEFITPPLDIINSVNSESNIIGIKSFPGFNHEILLGTEGVNYSNKINSDFSLKIIKTDDNSVSHEIEYELEGNLLKFNMPVSILNDTIFNVAHYNLVYSINNKEGFFIHPDFNDLPYVISVFDPEPSFFNIMEINKEICNDTNIYRLRFTGSFLNSLNWVGFEVHNMINITLTKLENNSQIILDENLLNPNTVCSRGYKLLFTGDEQTQEGLNFVHTNVIMHVNVFETQNESFTLTPGVYKIKASFNNDENNFKETDEFEFTIP